ncbi:MAG: Ig-like domain-containing protein [Myxococcota bacterium]|nr:Ig-like domain-containing protein [Myxococcota bacterium]
MRLIPLFALLFAGCSKSDSINLEETGVIDTQDTEDSDTETDTDTEDTDTEDTDTEEPCSAEVTAISPADTADGIPADVLIVADFSDPADEATIAVSGPSGPVGGTTALAEDGLSATFAADEDLARASEYLVEVRVCEETTTSTFTTVPEAVDESSLLGRVYDLDLATVSWNEPSSTLADLLIGQIDTSHILLMVTEINETDQTISFVGAPGWIEQQALAQYPCVEAIDFDPADFTANPYFSVGPNNFTIDLAGNQIPVENLLVEASFDADASNLKNLHIQAFLDGSFVIPDLGFSICDFASIVGISCSACPVDSTRDCLTLDADAEKAPFVQGLTVDPEIDPSSNPDCN